MWFVNTAYNISGEGLWQTMDAPILRASSKQLMICQKYCSIMFYGAIPPQYIIKRYPPERRRMLGRKEIQ
jgi:hypothetical protein